MSFIARSKKRRVACNTSNAFTGRLFELPTVPVNMKTALDEAKSVWLVACPCFHVMHRFFLDYAAHAKRMHGDALPV
jgi:hypothetical protein